MKWDLIVAGWYQSDCWKWSIRRSGRKWVVYRYGREECTTSTLEMAKYEAEKISDMDEYNERLTTPASRFLTKGETT